MRLPSPPKAAAAGIISGLAAILFYLLMMGMPRIFVLPHVAALALTGLCGAYILIATWYDSIHNPRRGSRIVPLRGFDIAAGVILLGLAGLGLYPFLSLL